MDNIKFENLGIKKEAMRKFAPLPIELVKDQVNTEIKTNYPVLYKTTMQGLKSNKFKTMPVKFA